MIQNAMELPGMIRNLGSLLQNPRGHANPAGIAGQYLGVKFGWMPLVDDLSKLLDFQSHVLKRTAELYNLYYNESGLRRRLQFSNSTTNSTATHLFGITPSVYGTTTISITDQVETWGSINWRPTALPPGHSNDQRWNGLARRLVGGMTPEGLAKGLWDVIPWTWMLGWFTNVGKYALAYSNTVPATHGAGCFMSKCTRTLMVGGTTYTGPIGTIERLTNPYGGATIVRSTRISATDVLAGAFVPYIDTNRLSVLGALFSQRFMR
jgi:hypothetical protein